MTEERIGRVVRALRHRLGWTQAELGRRAGCSGSVISRVEAGRRGSGVALLSRILEAVGGRLVISAQWRGGELDRLLDADHAALQERWAIRKRHCRPGLMARQEVTYSEWGERGSIDDLAFDPVTRTLLVTEIKTTIVDLQELLARLDQKERLAARLAARLGWRAACVVPCLVIADTRTNRRRVAQHAAMFARFDCRGRAAALWLRRLDRPIGGLLRFESLPSVRGAHGRRAGRQRVRHRSARASSAPAGGSRAGGHEPA